MPSLLFKDMAIHIDTSDPDLVWESLKTIKGEPDYCITVDEYHRLRELITPTCDDDLSLIHI